MSNLALGLDQPATVSTTLRPYQHRAIEMLDAAVANGAVAPLLVMPTGAGKTRVAAHMMQRAVERGQRALFLAPRRELVTQTSRQLVDLNLPHGVILAGADYLRDTYARVQIASIDTMMSRVVRHQRLVLPDFDLLLVDEAHLSITRTRERLLERWPNATRIGLTATPTRKDGRALGLLYDRLIEPVTVADLQRDGYLVGARYFSISEPDLARVRTIGGDYHQGELEQVVNRPQLVGDIVGHWLAHAATRRTVVFASSIAHSVALCEAFLHAGVAAEHVDADTPQVIRDGTFDRFRSGATQVLTNVFLASFGFDLPELSCVILARPTRSLMLYLQMLGRGLRPAAGKRDCVVMDHSGSVHRHGFAHDPRVWTLDGHDALVSADRSAQEERERKQLTCPECACVFSGARLCPECGYFFAPKGKDVETLDGELIEIGEQIGREERDRKAWYAELRGFAEEKGYKTGWAAYKFKEHYGTWPPRAWNYIPPTAPSVETRRWIKSQAIRWLKSREAASV